MKTCSLNPHMHSRSGQKKQKIPVSIKKKTVPDADNIAEQISEIKSYLQKMAVQPPNLSVNNLSVNNNLTVNNYIVIESTKYTDIIDKLGKDETIKLLATGRIMDVIKKLYFDGVEPNQYPVACREDLQFRFLNGKSEMVDDQGGTEINRVIVSTMQNAMLSAVNEIINDHMKGKTSLSDIISMQDTLGTVQQHNIKPDLSKLSYNPDHPFFKMP